jgi:hypothetical protein
MSINQDIISNISKYGELPDIINFLMTCKFIYQLSNKELWDRLASIYHFPMSHSLCQLIAYSHFEVYQLVNLAIVTDDLNLFSYQYSILFREQKITKLLLNPFIYFAGRICDYCINNNIFFDINKTLAASLKSGNKRYIDLLIKEYISHHKCSDYMLSLPYLDCKNTFMAIKLFQLLKPSTIIPNLTIKKLVSNRKWDILEFIFTNHTFIDSNDYYDILKQLLVYNPDVNYIIRFISLLSIRHHYSITVEHLKWVTKTNENTLIFVTLADHLPESNKSRYVAKKLWLDNIVNFIQKNNDIYTQKAKDILLQKGYIIAANIDHDLY